MHGIFRYGWRETDWDLFFWIKVKGAEIAFFTLLSAQHKFATFSCTIFHSKSEGFVPVLMLCLLYTSDAADE